MNFQSSKIYVPKCILIVSLYPFYKEHLKILRNIYMFTKSGKTQRPIEKIIERLIIGVPVPPRGLYKVI